MRTTLTIDDSLMQQVVKATGRRSPLEAVREALQAYVRQEQLKKVIALRGAMDIDDNWQSLRQLETAPLDPTSTRA
jgi:metal-responsive CopG/Arc/MetJ family transcriptional regulator